MGDYLIYGNGGHGRVVEDTLLQINPNVNVVFFDDQTNLYDSSYRKESLLIVAIGNNETRRNIVEKVRHKFGVVIHPSAYVSPTARLGVGTVVLANAVIQANAVVGMHCIINANVTIDHDAIIEDYVCTYPGSYVAGGARVKEGRMLGPSQIVWKKKEL